MAAIDHIQTGVGTAFVERLSTAVQRYRENRARRAMYRQTIRELGNLTDRDLDDLGIHRSMIRSIATEAAFGPAM